MIVAAGARGQKLGSTRFRADGITPHGAQHDGRLARLAPVAVRAVGGTARGLPRRCAGALEPWSGL